ncbi:MAG: hypothetical protein FWC76_07815, partial [Defluviitaleaceae bacterium]|nr:hypothetical protein [Defluviitaleaceae bacterium]
KRWIICILFLPAVIGLASCGQNTSATLAPPLLAPVAAQADSALVTRGLVESVDILPGVTRSQTEAVRSETRGGHLGSIYAWPGDNVVEGQIVARLDASHIETQIENLEESMRRSRTLHRLQAEEMALQIEIMEMAYYEDPASALRERIEWLRLDLNHLQRRHNLDMAEAEDSLQGLAESLEDAEIRAAFDGEVVFVIGLGTWINANDSIMYIAQPEEVFVEYVGLTMDVPWSRRGVRVQGIIDGVITYDLELIPNTIEEQLYYSRRWLVPPIRFEILPGPYDMPPAGELVFIHFYTAWADDVLRIPSNALFSDGAGEAFVYRFEEGQQVQVYVTTGIITETYTEILNGLNEGDEVFVRP